MPDDRVPSRWRLILRLRIVPSSLSSCARWVSWADADRHARESSQSDLEPSEQQLVGHEWAPWVGCLSMWMRIPFSIEGATPLGASLPSRQSVERPFGAVDRRRSGESRRSAGGCSPGSDTGW